MPSSPCCRNPSRITSRPSSTPRSLTTFDYESGPVPRLKHSHQAIADWFEANFGPHDGSRSQTLTVTIPNAGTTMTALYSAITDFVTGRSLLEGDRAVCIVLDLETEQRRIYYPTDMANISSLPIFGRVGEHDDFVPNSMTMARRCSAA